jgi:hypothetical protein
MPRRFISPSILCGVFTACVLLATTVARAQSGDDGGGAEKGNASSLAKDAKQQLPIAAHTYSAFGATAGTIGAAAFGDSTSSKGSPTSLGGGLRVWGSPIDRLTIVLDGQRTPGGTSAPTAGAMFRIAGRLEDGWAFSALGKFKNDGFAHVEGEVEVGALLSYARFGVHADLNSLFGGDFDGQEMDSEGRARLGYDLASFARVGLDAQWRYRIAGERKLVGGRKWDFVGGPQVLVAVGNFFLSVTSGPSTVDVASGVGWSLMFMGGGMTL